MAENLSMALAELLRKADAEPDVDTLRDGVRAKQRAVNQVESIRSHLVPSRAQMRLQLEHPRQVARIVRCAAASTTSDVPPGGVCLAVKPDPCPS